MKKSEHPLTEAIIKSAGKQHLSCNVTKQFTSMKNENIALNKLEKLCQKISNRH